MKDVDLLLTNVVLLGNTENFVLQTEMIIGMIQDAMKMVVRRLIVIMIPIVMDVNIGMIIGELHRPQGGNVFNIGMVIS